MRACERYVDAQRACIESAFTAPDDAPDVESALGALATTCDFHAGRDDRATSRWFRCLARAAEEAACDGPASAQSVGEQQAECGY